MWIQAAKRNQVWRECVGGGKVEISAERQMAASESSKWSQAGALADRQNSVAQELGNKNMEMFPKGSKRTPHSHPTNVKVIAPLSAKTLSGEPGPRRWTQFPRKAWFKHKNHSPREIPLVSTFKSHNVKIRKACGFRIKSWGVGPLFRGNDSHSSVPRYQKN